jgi:hypothetical protein
MTDTQCAETPLRDDIARFWNYLETDTVRIVLDLKRTVGLDAPDGPIVYWDRASFSDDVAKAMVSERQRQRAALEIAAQLATALSEYLADPEWRPRRAHIERARNDAARMARALGDA